MSRNPDWNRDEVILALDLYLRHEGQLPPHAAAVELSSILRRLAGKTADEDLTFRNENGVFMKLGNIQSLDSRYTEGPTKKKGLTKGGKTERAVWNEFAHDPEHLRAVAAAIVAAIEILGRAFPDDSDEFAEASEGKVLSRLHRVRERSAGLRKKKIASVLKRGAAIECEVCSFDFGLTYGTHGEGFIEVHHLRPLHELVSETKTRLDELALVCANCHRMIHARKPWLSLQELKSLVAETLAARSDLSS